MSENAKFLSELAELERRFDALAPELELTVRDPDMRVEGYVVVWSTLAARNGPLGRIGKGGTRITPRTSLEEVRMLARIMTLKNAAAGLPLGGAKSGLCADPEAPDFEKKYRRFVTLVKPILTERGGIFGGFGFDVGGKPEHVQIVCDELKSTRSFTGKPLAMGGTDYDREGIAGLGVAVAADKLLEAHAVPTRGVKFSVQGAGAMGAAVVRHFSAMGAQLTVIADPRLGGCYRLCQPASSDLISSLARMDLSKAQQLLKAEADVLADLQSVLYEPTDVLFPCAMQEVIHAQNVSKISARFMVEGANNPCTREAYDALLKRGIPFIPDFIANPGGIIAAFVELTATVSPAENVAQRINPERAMALTREKIAENTLRVCELVKRWKVSPVAAGRYIALGRMFA